MDYEIIIAWNSNQEFIKIVEERFKDCIIFKKEIKLSYEDRCAKINALYSPIIVPTNSDRCTYTEPLTIFMVKLNPKYEYVYRTEGYRLCNMEILNFKIELRKQFNFQLFHCSDNIIETKKSIRSF